MKMPAYMRMPISCSACSKRCPHVSLGHGPAVRVDGDDLALGGRDDLVTVEGVGPDVGLIDAEERGDVEPMPPVGDASADDPPLDGLGVYLHGFGELGGRHPPLQQERSQPLVRHSTQARGTSKDGFTLAGTSHEIQSPSCRVVTAS